MISFLGFIIIIRVDVSGVVVSGFGVLVVRYFFFIFGLRGLGMVGYWVIWWWKVGRGSSCF